MLPAGGLLAIAVHVAGNECNDVLECLKNISPGRSGQGTWPLAAPGAGRCLGAYCRRSVPAAAAAELTSERRRARSTDPRARTLALPNGFACMVCIVGAAVITSVAYPGILLLVT